MMLIELVRANDLQRAAIVFEDWYEQLHQNKWPHRIRRDPDIQDDVVFLDANTQEAWRGFRVACRLMERDVDEALAKKPQQCQRHYRALPCIECQAGRTPG